jgi:hypothetical protein
MMPLSHHAPAAAVTSGSMAAWCADPMHHASFVRTAVNRDQLMLSTQGIDKKRCVSISWPRAVRPDALRCFTPKLFLSSFRSGQMCLCANNTSIAHLRSNYSTQTTESY